MRATMPGLPARGGVGLKSQHVDTILDTAADLGFFEVHAENYLVAGGPLHHQLGRIRERYALSIHGVGLSIGAEADLDKHHLARVRALVARYQPEMFSEHLAWLTHGGRFLNDLLPLPYTQETLQRVCQHVDEVQGVLGRQILLENPATYVEFSASTFAEPEFIREVVRRTGCGLLLDVNNAFVSCVNHGRDTAAYLAALPLAQTGEIHLAGYFADHDALGDPLLIDNHGAPVAEVVWDLYAGVLAQIGPVATLIERDHDIPPWPVLYAEAQRAQALLLAVRESSCA